LSGNRIDGELAGGLRTAGKALPWIVSLGCLELVAWPWGACLGVGSAVVGVGVFARIPACDARDRRRTERLDDEARDAMGPPGPAAGPRPCPPPSPPSGAPPATAGAPGGDPAAG